MSDIRQPRTEGLPNAQALGVNPTLFRTIEMLWQRTGGTDDEPFETSLAARDNGSRLEEIEDQLRRLSEEQTALVESLRGDTQGLEERFSSLASDQLGISESVRSDTLSEITRLVERLEDAGREMDSRPLLNDALDGVRGAIADLEARTEDTEQGLREKIHELADQIENMTVATEAVNAGASALDFAALSRSLIAPVTPGNGVLVNIGPVSVIRSLVTSGDGLSITAGDGAAGNPTFAVSDDLAALEALTGTNTIYYRSGNNTWSPVSVGDGLSFESGALAVNVTAAAPSITTVSGTSDDLNINANFTALEAAINSIRTGLGA